MSRSALSNGLIDARAFTLPVSVAIKLPSQPMSQKLRPERERLDRVLVSRGLVASREDAAHDLVARECPRKVLRLAVCGRGRPTAL